MTIQAFSFRAAPRTRREQEETTACCSAELLDVTAKLRPVCYRQRMTVIREFHSGTDIPATCEECHNAPAEIVIEEFYPDGMRVSVCPRCAMVALSEHPKLLASAVISLIRTSHIAVEV